MNLLSEGMDESAGDPFLSRAVCLIRKIEPSSVAVPSKSELGQRQGIRNEVYSHFTTNKILSTMVERSPKTSRGTFPASEEPRPSVVLRRIGLGVGSNTGKDGSLRLLDQRSDRMAHQPKGTDCYPSGSNRVRRSSGEKSSSGQLRQYDGVGLHQESGRHSLLLSIRDRQKAPSLDKGERCYSCYPLYSRRKECEGRHAEQKESSSVDRVDASPGRLQEPVADLGPTMHRPLRHSSNEEVGNLLFSRSRSRSGPHRRVSAGLVQLRRVCVSPIQSYSQSFAEVRSSRRDQDDPSGSLLAYKGMVHRGTGMDGGHPEKTTSQNRSTQTTPLGKISPKPPSSTNDCLQTIKKLARAKGFSKAAADAIARARRSSTIKVYQSKWEVFRGWCRKNSISSSSTSVTEIADFLLFLRRELNFSISTIKGYRSMLTAVFRHRNLDLSNNKDLQDLIRSFETIKEKGQDSPAWNLDVVLKFLMGNRFEPLHKASFKDLTLKTLFLISLATAKRVSEVHAFSKTVGFRQGKAICSLQLGFLAKNEIPSRPWPKTFEIPNLSDITGTEIERLLCPVRALKSYLERTKEIRGKSEALWCSVKKPSLPMSKNALSYFIRLLIREAHSEFNETDLQILKVKTHEVRAVATSVAFKQNRSLQSILDATFWRSKSVFASHYLKQVQTIYEDRYTLGPFVAANSVVGEGSTPAIP
ncbi:uncharacterized protein [Macrobrachium rosenbergii]|uniref:uncharacterized protein n=1 Tax=Macrobrachium rosenbergii TaxID=79674 RepID=UPI0034D6BB8B